MRNKQPFDWFGYGLLIACSIVFIDLVTTIVIEVMS